MSGSPFVWLPAAARAVVAVLCFVGCVLIYDYSGYQDQPSLFTDYRKTVLATPGLLAFRPLGEKNRGDEPSMSWW